jgi:hypothetical protein
MNEVVALRKQIADSKPKEWTHAEVDELLCRLCIMPVDLIKSEIIAIGEKHNLEKVKKLVIQDWDHIK